MMSHRNFSIDFLKVLASQIIVWHHLALYSPMSEFVEQTAPHWFGLLSWEGRYVVQIFLVIGGYLSLQSLLKAFDPQRNHQTRLFDVISKRFVRLGKPYWVALMAALAVTLVLEMWLLEEQLKLGQELYRVLAHVFMLHDVLGVEALSAGVWYVAIDFQLFALTAMIVWLAVQLSRLTATGFHVWSLSLLSILTVLGLYWFNRNPDSDKWALYFFGSYGLGMMCHWAKVQKRRLLWAALITALLWGALLIEWRERLMVAGFTAMVLLYGGELQRKLNDGSLPRLPYGLGQKFKQALSTWGDASYSVFLIHYPVILLVNAAVLSLDNDTLAVHLSAWLAAWLISLGSGYVMHKKLG